MSLQKKTATPSNVKLEMTPEQLNMMVYMLGAIDLRTEPETLQTALDLRKKLQNALEVFKPKNNTKKDKYGKMITEEDLTTQEAEASQAA